MRLSVTDLDRNGLVDGSEKSAYQIYDSAGAPLLITKKSGRTISEQSSSKWSVLASAPSRKGHLVLIANNRSKKSKYRIWSVNRKGIVRSKGQWELSRSLSRQGFEDIFAIDFNTDGLIEGKSLINAGDAHFAISGTYEVGNKLRIQRHSDDPDGNGRAFITWQAKLETSAWRTVDIRKRFKIPSTLDGHQVRAKVEYIDGDDFQEIVYTHSANIPYINDGDAAFLIQGTPDVGQTLSLNRTIDDPDGNGDGSIEVTWQASLDGVNWWELSTNSSFIIPKTLEGHRIAANVTYTDTQGFRESIDTDYLPIPFIDDGDAAFLIQGTPDVGQTLSLNRTIDDPDGNGDGSIEVTWQASLDGVNWWELSTANLLQIGDDLAGHQLNALIRYTDGEGFKESISSDTISIPGIAEFNLNIVDDYNGNASTNGRIAINSNISGELETVGDRDWFSINLTTGNRYQFDLEGIYLEDPFLHLRDSSSTLIDYNDDKSLFSLDSQLTFTPKSTDTYYIDVGSYFDVYTGSYTLRASEVSALDPSFSTTDGYGHISAQRAFEQLLNISLDPVDPLEDNLWGVDNVDVPEVWNGGSNFAGVTGKGTTIAVIDTGIDLDHPEFSDRIVSGYDFVDNDSIADDGEGHGTHVAGIIAGANDGRGITGIAYDAEIMPLRALDDDGYGWTSDIVSALQWAADNGADVINLSLGEGGYSQAMADAISYASDRGSVVVMAAGNSGSSTPVYPAAHAIDHGIAVGAVDRDRSLAGFSNRAGSRPMDYVTAPGVNIYSAVPGGGYDSFNGTSMAAPYVAGVAGLLKSYDGSLSASTIEDLLTGSGSNHTISSATLSNSSSVMRNTRDVITLQTLENFSDSELSGTLIGRVDGSGQERRSTLRALKKGIRSNSATTEGLVAVKTIEASRNSFAKLKVSDEHTVDQRKLLTDLLATNQFNYFEIDQQFSIL